jgi:uncharacterized YigZ family protein
MDDNNTRSLRPYKSAASSASASFEEKKSIFIGYACPVPDEESALRFIEDIKSRHRDATHNVWAYVLRHNNTSRFSDDREPQGTAGMPVLGVITKSGLTDTAVVVTRYFGGTLLGAGGLVRAYTQGAALALKSAGTALWEGYAFFELSCTYSDYERILKELERLSVSVKDTSFTDNVSISCSCKESEAEKLETKIIDITNGRVFATRTGSGYGFSVVGE